MLKVELEDRVDELESALEEILAELDKDEPNLNAIAAIAEDTLGEEEEEGEEEHVG